MDRLHRAKALLADLIAFPSVSADSNLDLIAYVAHVLEEAGARVDISPSPCGTKANLFATIGPDVAGGILLSGHSDVVPVTDQDWTSDPFQMVERDGKLFGRGACDMKGFLAAMLTMAPVLGAQVRDRPLHFAITYDEEVGCLGAQHLVERLQKQGVKPSVAIIGEPTMMRIIEGHKGCHEYTTRFVGLPGHSSQPDKGVNAVEYAARFMNHLLQIKDQLRGMAPADSRFDPPWPTLNIGEISGGVAHNVIAPTATVAWEMRPVHPTDVQFVWESIDRFFTQDLLPAMQAISPDAVIETEVIGEAAALVPTADNAARELVASLTGQNTASLVSFGTEAGIFQALGTHAVVCGPGSIEQAHKADEFLAVDQLADCLEMLDGLGARLNG
ncbi:acetylornithine deacetylase [Epibacterium ulvae]|uniref:acetylornithine deacetylase n=1 Tax=Epibacterium ulvae TaxID=1156985 RepID=UPI001BFC00E0|nr:acetylornithine deacetylase [Epibacterium ulvae]MBT8154179.1 acetylornithine deacetylase [Epibacterium ulvae]